MTWSQPGAALLVVGLAVGIGACSSDDKGGSSGPIAQMLAQLPEPAAGRDLGTITYADLDRASEAAGVDRPDPDDLDVGSIYEWLGPITGVAGDGEPSTVSIFLPSLFAAARLEQNEEIDEELGWNVRDVHSFVESGSPPVQFAILEADVDTDDLTDAMGEPDEGIWSLGGEDGEVSPADRTAARPLGESLRFGLNDDGLLGVARTTPPVAAFLAEEGDVVADDEQLLAVAEVLDDKGVYTAAISRDDIEPGPGDSPAVLDEFEAMGVGLAADDDQPLLVLVYVHDDEEGASANEEIVTDLLEDGTTVVGQPYDELFDVVEIERDGARLVVVLELRDDVPARILQQLVFQRDPLTVDR